MAVDMKKKLGKASGPMPSKTTMNLAYHESEFNAKKIIPLLVILVIGVGVFMKFGVLDQLTKKARAYTSLGEKQMELSLLNAKLADYDEIMDQYGRYSFGWMTDEEAGLVERTEVLKLIEDKLAENSTIVNFAVANNTVTANVTGITLDEGREIIKQLEEDGLVTSATLYSAKADDETLLADIFMQFVLEKEAE